MQLVLASQLPCGNDSNIIYVSDPPPDPPPESPAGPPALDPERLGSALPPLIHLWSALWGLAIGYEIKFASHTNLLKDFINLLLLMFWNNSI